MIAALHGKLRGLRSDWLSAGPPEFVVPVAMSLVAVLLTTVVLFAIDAQLAPQHLVLGYLLPTIFIAVYYGSTFAVLTSFASGLAAAYFLFPPKFSFYVGDFTHAPTFSPSSQAPAHSPVKERESGEEKYSEK